MRIRKDIVAKKLRLPEDHWDFSMQKMCPFCGSINTDIYGRYKEWGLRRRSKRRCLDCKGTWAQDQMIVEGCDIAVVTGGVSKTWLPGRRGK